MKLNKLQRYTAYCIMLEEVSITKFFCAAIGVMGFPAKQESIEKYFPELWAKKPKNPLSVFCWFSWNDLGKREQLLRECILETHP